MKKWVNWVTILTSLVSLIVIGSAKLGWDRARAEYASYQDVKREVAQNKIDHQELKESAKLLRQMAGDITAIKRQVMTVSGYAMVREFGDVPMFRVNITSRAAQYNHTEKARITNMSSPEQPSVIVKIEGIFRHADENYLGILSKRAADMIDAQTDTRMNIRIAPPREVP